MDGWESRRRRGPGEDYALIRLGAAGVIRRVVVNTAHFTGNFPAACSVAACAAEGYPGPAELAGLWDQLVQALVALARDGLAHGDLSAYNLLVHDGRLVMIDLPQVVDVVANPRGGWYLNRDAENAGRWFTARGLTGVRPEPADLPGLLHREAML